ncbi:cupin domain-containing protein (plasmid) [Halobaculum magnesiiphilum]|uniref:Cupin domain-containing protein n=2 Tax=Halobaculum magnesiiphilum TaxID=1017351 RepID=A0A8T8WIA5_9EURY|nr:cupin domain-containing protein [Halobaculum magnesiiphilum]
MTEIRTLMDIDGQPHANVFPDSEPKTIRLRLSEGDEVAPHSHPGRDIVFYLVEGTVEVKLDDDRYEVTAGDIARFEGEREISPRALEDSTALIVLSPRPED